MDEDLARDVRDGLEATREALAYISLTLAQMDTLPSAISIINMHLQTLAAATGRIDGRLRERRK